MIDDIRPPMPQPRPTPKPAETPVTPAVTNMSVAPEPVIDNPKPSKIQMPNPAAFSGPGGANGSQDSGTDATKDAGTPATEPVFKTPESVADAENPDPTPPQTPHHDVPGRPWYKPGWPPTKKQWIIYAACAVVLLGGGGAAWALTHTNTPDQKKIVKKSTKKTVAPTPIYSTLSGLQIQDENLNKKPVTGVMIENSVDARPQSGLGQAGVVFEAVAEGGVTRFLALFQDTAPADVGPIRSARPYYMQWAMGFDAAYAHVGGSPDALNDIKAWGTKDMNQFYNADYFHRISSRVSPHNVYSSISAFNELEAKKGFTSTYTGFTRKKDAAASAPNANSIDFNLSGYTYNPHYDYDAATNSYKRSEAGAAHMDAGTSQQISPKVVIAMVTPLSQGALDSSGAYYSNYTVTGTGTAYVFQDGTVTVGNWNKASTSGALTFTDGSGKTLALNRGQTWISAVSATSAVSYK